MKKEQRGLVFKSGKVTQYLHRGYQTYPSHDKIDQAFGGFYPLIAVETITTEDGEGVLDIYIEDDNGNIRFNNPDFPDKPMRRVVDFLEIDYLLNKLEMSRAEELHSGVLSKEKLRELSGGKPLTIRSGGRNREWRP